MRVKALAYASIQTDDLQEWREYATDVLGMMESTTSDDNNLYLKMDERSYRLHIVKGKDKRYLCSGWEVAHRDDFAQLLVELDASGVDYKRADEEYKKKRKVQDLISLVDPSGNHLEVCYGCEQDYTKFTSKVGLAGFHTGEDGVLGFGHTVIPAPNLKETHDFYQELLGFADSDYMHFHFNPDPSDPGQGMHFMHCDNPRHHSLGLYQDPTNEIGCVHIMVQVPTVDDVGRCLDRVNERKIPIVSTLGRHTNDHMLSFYMVTPSGFALEYGCEGREPDWTTHRPTVSALPSFWGHKFSL